MSHSFRAIRFSYVLIGVVLLLVGFVFLKVSKATKMLDQKQASLEYKREKELGISDNFLGQSFPPQFTEKNLFDQTIKLVSQSLIPNSSYPQSRVTGITVPHHLLAADLIAKAFLQTANQKYDKIILISPDHFSLGSSDISISEKDFNTTYGTLKTDLGAVKNLEEKDSNIKPADFFYREHGVGAELPFIKYWHPDIPIVVITLKETSKQEEVDSLIDSLETVITENTLIVQSTDFSHYLTKDRAEAKDLETLNVLQQKEAADLWKLNQPDNLDSIASQYVQSRLQKEFFKSSLKIIAHKNSQDYTPEPVSETTSYIVQVYTK